MIFIFHRHNSNPSASVATQIYNRHGSRSRILFARGPNHPKSTPSNVHLFDFNARAQSNQPNLSPSAPNTPGSYHVPNAYPRSNFCWTSKTQPLQTPSALPRNESQRATPTHRRAAKRHDFIDFHSRFGLHQYYECNECHAQCVTGWIIAWPGIQEKPGQSC